MSHGRRFAPGREVAVAIRASVDWRLSDLRGVEGREMTSSRRRDSYTAGPECS